MSQPNEPPTTATETLLVVENESAIRTLVQIALERHGYRVLTAESGLDALRVAAGHEGQIALLITDVHMADLPGPDLAAQLAALRPGLATLFMSGYPDDALEEQGALPANVDFIPKPFSPRVMVSKVREVLDRSQGRRVEQT